MKLHVLRSQEAVSTLLLHFGYHQIQLHPGDLSERLTPFDRVVGSIRHAAVVQVFDDAVDEGGGDVVVSLEENDAQLGSQRDAVFGRVVHAVLKHRWSVGWV